MILFPFYNWGNWVSDWLNCHRSCICWTGIRAWAYLLLNPVLLPPSLWSLILLFPSWVCREHYPEALGIGSGFLKALEKEENPEEVGPDAWLVGEARYKKGKTKPPMGEGLPGAQRSLHSLSSLFMFLWRDHSRYFPATVLDSCFDELEQ